MTSILKVNEIDTYDNTASINIKHDGTSALVIDTSGNVLVGTTDVLPYVNNNEGISLSAGSYGGLLCASRDGYAPLDLNRKTSDGSIIQFRKNGSQVGVVGAYSSSPFIANTTNSAHKGLRFTGSQLKPCTYTGANDDGNYDLGSATTRFKDAYLSGNIYLGGTGSANALDDYEEGTFTVTTAGDATGAFTAESGEYTKIGRMVYIRIIFGVSTNFTGRAIGGLPFQVDTDTSGGSSWTPANFLADSSTNNQIIPKFANGTTTVLFDENDTNNDQHPPDTGHGLYRVSGWYITNS